MRLQEKTSQLYPVRAETGTLSIAVRLILLVWLDLWGLLICRILHPALQLLLSRRRIDQGAAARQHHLAHQFTEDEKLIGRQDLPELGFDLRCHPKQVG